MSLIGCIVFREMVSGAWNRDAGDLVDSRKLKGVLCDVVFSSKHPGKVDGFLDRHQIAIISARKLNSACPQFPVVVSFEFTPVKYLYCLIAANSRKREQKQLSFISLLRSSLYRFTNRLAIRDFFGQGRGCGLLTYTRRSLQLEELASVFGEKRKILFALLDDAFARSSIHCLL